jgi:uncharacterized protein
MGCRRVIARTLRCQPRCYWRTAVHPNEELARREIELLESGDLAAVAALYADDFVLHYPGRNPLAGTYSNAEDFFAKLNGLFEEGTIKRELHDALGTDQHAVQLVAVEAEVQERSHSWKAAIVMHVRDGKFYEAWLHFDDQYALDDFLNSLGGS